MTHECLGLYRKELMVKNYSVCVLIESFVSIGGTNPNGLFVIHQRLLQYYFAA